MIAQLAHQLCLLAILSASLLLGMLFFMFDYHWVDFSVLEQYHSGRPSIVLDDEGNEWTRFQLDRREPIRFNAMPTILIQAFIAAEDWEFFNHRGIALKGIARSMLVNLYHGRIVQGASTITQQLVKLLFFDSQKTFSRKIKEQLCALVVEHQFTKEQIMETYLNHVYFGCGIYGVQAASQRFWSKNAHELTLGQSALLAAIVRSPAHYCPLLCPLSAEKRRNVILGKIDQEARQDAQAQAIDIKVQDDQVCAPHLKETLRIQCEELVGKRLLYTGGLMIATTINQRMQQHAQKIFTAKCQGLRDEFKLNNLDGALIAIESKSGAIKALVGGVDFGLSKFNRALQARRQIGSVLKPVIFAAALQNGLRFTDTMLDEPIEIIQDNKPWRPRNFNRKFNGQVTLAYALSHSNNMVTIKTLLATGTEPIIDLAKKCRLSGPFHTYPSLALGTIDGTLKEVVGMFNVFASHGEYVEPHYLRWIKNQWGTKIIKNTPEQERVVPARISDQIAKVLGLGVLRVRNYFGKQWINAEAISKTGTTNDSRTCWFVGATPSLTTAVYIGCDDNRSMGNNIYPLRTALPIWLTFNRELDCQQKTFTFDPSLREIMINEKTGEPVWHMRDAQGLMILV